MVASNPSPTDFVTACVVTHNSAAVLEAALASLNGQSHPHIRILVVDNASTDASPAVARRHSTTVMQMPNNAGFGAAVNVAIRNCSDPYLLVMNPDVVLDRDAVATMLKHLVEADDRLAAVQPKLLLPARDAEGRRRIDSLGIGWGRSILHPRDLGHGLVDRGQFRDPRDVFGTTGACSLWRTAALRALARNDAVLDESYFLYYEDVDLAWRAERAGFIFQVCPAASGEHDRADPPRHGHVVDGIAFVNRFLLVAKNASAGAIAQVLPELFLMELPRLVVRTLTRRGYGRVWRHLLRGLFPALRRLTSGEKGTAA